jgi:hypothetical protein
VSGAGADAEHELVVAGVGAVRQDRRVEVGTDLGDPPLDELGIEPLSNRA